jgi:hypothetical protein
MTEIKLLRNGKAYTTAAATNVMATIERQLVDGKPWVRPSRDPAIIAKWDYFQKLHLQTEETQSEVPA